MLKDYINSKRQYSSGAICEMEHNLACYFSSADYQFNEVKSFLENKTNIPLMNTRESRDTSINKVSLSSESVKEFMKEDATQDINNLKESKEKKMFASERNKLKHQNHFNNNYSSTDFYDMQNQNDRTNDPGLEFIRSQINLFLQKESNTPTTKVLQ
jgi:hypothetical protein